MLPDILEVLSSSQGQHRHSTRGVGTVKRALFFLILCCFCIPLPNSASAWPAFVVFTFQTDPLDPLGATSTGWFRAPGDVPIRYDFEANANVIEMDFWWQTQHWTSQNAMLSFFYINSLGAIGGWRLDGGLENLHGDILYGDAPVGNDLDHLFDFAAGSGSAISSKGAGGGPPIFGETYACIMNYVNPTTSQHAANGSNYIATGTYYFTDDQPGPPAAPGIPEPSSLSLLILGLSSLIACRAPAIRR